MKFLAAFFVLYALLDISVLQVYCGNEAIGIPPAAVLATLETGTQKDHGPANEEGSVGISKTTEDSPSNDIPVREDACFCCCSHTTPAAVFSETGTVRQAAAPASAPNFSLRHLHPDSHPSAHYQPPKFS